MLFIGFQSHGRCGTRAGGRVRRYLKTFERKPGLGHFGCERPVEALLLRILADTPKELPAEAEKMLRPKKKSLDTSRSRLDTKDFVRVRRIELLDTFFLRWQHGEKRLDTKFFVQVHAVSMPDKKFLVYLHAFFVQ